MAITPRATIPQMATRLNTPQRAISNQLSQRIGSTDTLQYSILNEISAKTRFDT
jgi:hypothetical protein